MIYSIRKKHRIIWICLTVLLATTFVTSVVFRHNEPINEKIPRVQTK